jgi:outer membrane protein OmpA-like peptidoglycan-associated protein
METDNPLDYYSQKSEKDRTPRSIKQLTPSQFYFNFDKSTLNSPRDRGRLTVLKLSDLTSNLIRAIVRAAYFL